jgi:hypothetical protein
VISLLADRRDIAAGAGAMVPWLAGVAPFGLTCPDLDKTVRLIQAGTDRPIRRPEAAHGLRGARGFAVPASRGCKAGDSAAVPGPAGRQARRPTEPAAPAWGLAWRRSV